MSEFQKKMLDLAQFEAENQQVLDCLHRINALLDHALDPATPRDEAERDAALAEAMVERFEMLCDGQKPS